ncbi:hypothetical protein RHMOL_Rhmol05G0292100 [Rhododendron molle]|uniref:Uncharacterized protein n=1 Tax=Rhododendron molle TaxID=49168 RepID=A0ACC0NWL9_RHOML|nr:hypothetical protein RHMOL_Rhmol05G0292100 [Rhododendron molle]
MFEREETEVYDDLELAKSSNAGVYIVDIEEIGSSFLYHSNEVTEKFWAKIKKARREVRAKWLFAKAP